MKSTRTIRQDNEDNKVKKFMELFVSLESPIKAMIRERMEMKTTLNNWKKFKEELKLSKTRRYIAEMANRTNNNSLTARHFKISEGAVRAIRAEKTNQIDLRKSKYTNQKRVRKLKFPEVDTKVRELIISERKLHKW